MSDTRRSLVDRIAILREVRFGDRVAELERDQLESYFVETIGWRKLFSGDVDVVFGAKGTGKSALCTLLTLKADQLRERHVVTALADRPAGFSAFRKLPQGRVLKEETFTELWKFYFLLLVIWKMKDEGVKHGDLKKIENTLKKAGLWEEQRDPEPQLDRVRKNLPSLKRARVKGGVSPPFSHLEAEAEFGPADGTAQNTDNLLPVEPDRLLKIAGDVLSRSGLTIWILLDRLDEAFPNDVEKEIVAIRALLRTYLDLQGHRHIKLKLFLRGDVYDRAVKTKAFPGLAAITRDMKIAWDELSLGNLIVKRLLSNPRLCTALSVDPGEVLASWDDQKQLLYTVFPRWMGSQSRENEALKWIIDSTADGTGTAAPREIIQLLEQSRDIQEDRCAKGDFDRTSAAVIDSSALWCALEQVSQDRLEKTLFAEFGHVREYVDKLRNGKPLYSPGELAALWAGLPNPDPYPVASELVERGFFAPRNVQGELRYWVPYLYRDALGISQPKDRPRESYAPSSG